MSTPQCHSWQSKNNNQQIEITFSTSFWHTPGGKFRRNEISSNPILNIVTSQRKRHCHGRRVVQWPFDHSCYCQMMMMIVTSTLPWWSMTRLTIGVPRCQGCWDGCRAVPLVPAMDTFQSRINIGSHSDLSILTCSDMLWKCQGWTQSQALTLHLTVKLLAPTRESWVAWLRTPSICIHVPAYGLPQRSPAYCQLASSKGQGDTISLLLPLRSPPL